MLGGGPSVTPQYLASLAYTDQQVLAINRSIALYPKAMVGLFQDRNIWEWYGSQIKDFKGRLIHGRHPQDGPLIPGVETWHTQFIQPLELSYPRTLSHGWSTGYAAINLAIRLGARKLILLGYDYKTQGAKAHWHAEHPITTPSTAYVRMLAPFQELPAALEKIGVEVWNASADSHLSVFPFCKPKTIPVQGWPPKALRTQVKPHRVAILVRQESPWPGQDLVDRIKGAFYMHPLHWKKRHFSKDEDRVPVIVWTSRGEQMDAVRGYPGPIIIAENGTFSHWRRGQVSLSFGVHNNVQGLPIGVGSRWTPLRDEPYRPKSKPPNSPILVIGQFGGSDPAFTMPRDWPRTVVAKLRTITDRPIIFRPKPGTDIAQWADLPVDQLVNPHTAIEPFIDTSYCTVVWTSAVATLSLARGTPVIYQGPSIWAADASAGKNLYAIPRLENPNPRVVERTLERLSWASWNRDELTAAWDWLWRSARPT